jgi:hypothetical protein
MFSFGHALQAQTNTAYGDEHRHSGLGLLTPAMVHHGQAPLILAQRQEVLTAAYLLHPERFVRFAPKPATLPKEVWINKPQLRNSVNYASECLKCVDTRRADFTPAH